MTELFVNGRKVRVEVPPGTRLIYVLRNDLALNGPKLGCARGQCGACTIHLDGIAARSCQISIEAVQGRSITTLEGLGTPDRPHPVQAAFIAEQALQCGYCTNGMIMQAAALIAAKPSPSEAEVSAMMNANLCRCGCQPRVVRAVMKAAGRTL
ncbi:MAG: (2Fe-2S)-binding protein [Betaproteobacteria bacterium]|nr:(2Fe-2S)-binding protein [Betaproteobacteria bacterium]